MTGWLLAWLVFFLASSRYHTVLGQTSDVDTNVLHNWQELYDLKELSLEDGNSQIQYWTTFFENSHRKNQWCINNSNKYKVNGIFGELAAFGDVEGLRKTDLFYIEKVEGLLRLNIRLFDPKLKEFRESIYISLPKEITEAEAVIPVDVNVDGLLDIIIVSGTASSLYHFHVAIQKTAGYFEFVWNSESSNIKASAHPIIVDINFDRVPDLLFDADIPNQLVRQRALWVASFDEHQNLTYSFVLFEKLNQVHVRYQNEPGELLPSLSSPHSAAYLDVDGDCVADLVLDVKDSKDPPTRYLEIWLTRTYLETGQPTSSGKPFYKLHSQSRLELPPGSKQISFADINGDGSMDVIYPVSDGANPKENSLEVIFNRQIPLCKTTFFGVQLLKDNCKDISNLCTSYDFYWDIENRVSLKLSSMFEEDNLQIKGSSRYPEVTRVGDFNSDGYPDVALVVHSLRKSSSFILLLENIIPKTKTHVGRIFLPYKFLPLKSTNIGAVAFIDLGEEGYLDIIATTYEEVPWYSMGTKPRAITESFVQKVVDGSLFIKSTGIVGIPSVKVQEDQVELSRMYSSTLHGGTFKISGSDLDGKYFSRVAPLMHQTSYSSLQLPYSVIGLGNVNNYINYFYFGAPLVATKSEDLASVSLSSRRWSSIIPTSSLIINPFPRTDSSKWDLELLLNPSRLFWKTFLMTGISLFLVGFAIFIMDWREKVEKKQESQGFRTHFFATA